MNKGWRDLVLKRLNMHSKTFKGRVHGARLMELFKKKKKNQYSFIIILKGNFKITLTEE